MQSRPTEVSKTNSTTAQSPNSQNRQHGFHSHDPQIPQPPSVGDGVEVQRGAVSETDFTELYSTQVQESTAASPRRLSTEQPQRGGSPVDRITEYERAWTPSPKQVSQGLSFKIVSRQRITEPRVPLGDFPNEVLTHIFSYLPPPSLSAVATVSRRFHSLVTTPHAWRTAFSRYFVGPDALAGPGEVAGAYYSDYEGVRSERRVFTRLTTLASWRSEYILRTRLLRSLARGKPVQAQGLAIVGSSRSGPGHSGNAQITYSSNLFTTVNHIQASYGTEADKKPPRFIHAADETGLASSSDPTNGRVDKWGSSDPQSSLQFAERFPGDAQYGLGSGDVVGLPNSMDVSQKYGMVHAEGSPGGRAYFRSTEEQRGRPLAISRSTSAPVLGIPRLDSAAETMCSIWIAKNSAVPSLTNGLIGILVGSSYGILTSYSLGTNVLGERRLERGEVTARWVLSPGVPIIAIAVDEHYSPSRSAQKRLWAVVLNALGEVFYLTTLPSRRLVDRSVKLDDQNLDELAWETGRSVGWSLVEQSRRQAKPDPFDKSDIDGSYSPRSSWNGMELGKNQIIAETIEIETFLKQKPRHFQEICYGWDMRRRLEVDFGGDCGNQDGEAIVVVGCGFNEEPTYIRRLTRCKVEQDFGGMLDRDLDTSSSTPIQRASASSAFGGVVLPSSDSPAWSFDTISTPRSKSPPGIDAKSPEHVIHEWRVSEFDLGGLKATQVAVTAMDDSNFAHLTVVEDPLLSLGGVSATSSPLGSPFGHAVPIGSASDIPGQRARFVAAGTKSGSILIWNVRAPIASNTETINDIYPVRIIHTDSPQISCLALTALYLVHGGNDGLVQAWDPLASTTQPIRTLNSRFSSRARRRLVQAEASVQGVGVNLFAAGAISLDPDPTVLRGMVSLGTHLRYWSYSSSAADQYKSSKRRARRSERGSNHSGDKFSQTGRGALQDYIANERADLEREKAARRKENERFAGRFGLDLLGPGASDDEILAYATLLSEEAARNDEARRKSESEGSVFSQTDDPSVLVGLGDNETDPDIVEAIRLSLQQTEDISTPVPEFASAVDFPMKFAKKKRSPSSSPRQTGMAGGKKGKGKQDDLEFVLQLSLAEEESRRAAEEFPPLEKSPSPPVGKGKGKEKRRAS